MKQGVDFGRPRPGAVVLVDDRVRKVRNVLGVFFIVGGARCLSSDFPPRRFRFNDRLV
jgi:hypothetical protein